MAVEGTATAAPAGLPSIQDVAQAILNKKESGEGGAVTAAPVTEEVVEETAETEETQEVPEKKEEPQKDRFASKFAALSRKEREIKAKEKQIEDQMKQMKSDLESMKGVKETLANLRKSPLKTLKDLNVSYQDVTNDVLGSYKEPEQDPIDAKIQPLLARLEAAEGKSKELDELKVELREREVAQAEGTLRVNLRNTITENLDKFELCSTMGDEAIELSRQILQVYYEQHGKVLSFEEILGMTEEHYQEQVLKKLLTAKKAKELAGYKAPATTTSPKVPPTKGPSATLTNAQRGHQETVDINKLGKEDAFQYLIKKHLNK